MFPTVRQIEIQLPGICPRSATLFIELNDGALTLELADNDQRWGLVLTWAVLIHLIKQHGKKKF